MASISDLSPLERTRCLQAMLFGTPAGEILQDLFMEAGHFYEEIKDDAGRIEHNLVKHIMDGCGITLEFKPKSLPATEPSAGNVIDRALKEARAEEGDPNV